MRLASLRRFLVLGCAATLVVFTGCGNEEIALKDAPPVNIEPPKTEDASGKKEELKSGAPPKGSSSGMNFNPSETPRPQ